MGGLDGAAVCTNVGQVSDGTGPGGETEASVLTSLSYRGTPALPADSEEVP